MIYKGLGGLGQTELRYSITAAGLLSNMNAADHGLVRTVMQKNK